jgi:asparagine synthase (glutamine-hydrolysing)
MVDFASRLPISYKLKRLDEVVKINENEPGPKTQIYFEKTQDGKVILKETLKRYVPQGIVDQKKQGFSAPDASWFRGESIEYIKKVVTNKKAKMFDYMDYDTITNLVFEHLEGKQNRRLFIWSLLNFEMWLRTFMS